MVYPNPNTTKEDCQVTLMNVFQSVSTDSVRMATHEELFLWYEIWLESQGVLIKIFSIKCLYTVFYVM